MNKISEFYIKAMSDKTAKEELAKILDGKDFSSADDKKLIKIGELAERLGFDITIEEVKAFLGLENGELDEEELDAVAGGKGVTVYEKNFGDCNGGVGGVRISVR